MIRPQCYVGRHVRRLRRHSDAAGMRITVDVIEPAIRSRSARADWYDSRGRNGIVEQQQTCPRCEAPGQRFARRCHGCGRRYWGGGLLRMLFGGGPPMKH